MSCCGSQRAAARPTQAPGSSGDARHWSAGAVMFEYSGQGQLVVTGPLTGTVYRFGGGAGRVSVHGSDAPSLVSVPGLKLVR
ncbi:hypothetical protein [uncultured Paludibaculum sp.]|uniref:hypothetical protein n=1 Tax=uncultured Paludibaculum sp. TaxID=1765020 RepID=UPI002AAA6C2E|nr:hypothetical protein [uncultured Paludibaculum sp.]